MSEKNSQLPNLNFTQIPNIVFDYWMPILSNSTFKILMCFCRKTFGWHKTSEIISKNQLVKVTGISKNTIKNAIDELIKYKLVTVHKISNEYGNQPNGYQLNICKPDDTLYTDEKLETILERGRSEIDPPLDQKLTHIKRNSINKEKEIYKEKTGTKVPLASKDAHISSSSKKINLKKVKPRKIEVEKDVFFTELELTRLKDKFKEQLTNQEIDEEITNYSIWKDKNCIKRVSDYKSMVNWLKSTAAKKLKAAQSIAYEDPKFSKMYEKYKHWYETLRDQYYLDKGFLIIEGEHMYDFKNKDFKYKKSTDKFKELLETKYAIPESKINFFCKE